MLKEKIRFEISHLKSLLESESSCVSVVNNVRGKLSMLPFHLGYLKRAVKELLDDKVSKYDPELNGIILGHSNIKVINYLQHSDSWKIDLSYIADIYIFTPSIGKNITGFINKKSEEHIGCLIHSAFNASIPKPRHSGVDLNVWKHIHGNVQIGQDLDFTVSKVDFSSRIPYIGGIIVRKDCSNEEEEDVDSGCCQDSFEVATFKNKKEKIKSKDNPLDDLKNEMTSYHDPDHISELLGSGSQVTKKGKRKKCEKFDSDNEASSSTSSRKKRHKNEVSSQEIDEIEDVQPLKNIKIEAESPKKTENSSSIKKKSKRTSDADTMYNLEKVKNEPFTEEPKKLSPKGALSSLSMKSSPSKKKIKCEPDASKHDDGIDTSDLKLSKKQKRLSFPVKEEDIKLEYIEEVDQPKSKRKRSDLSITDVDDSSPCKPKKKKSRKSKDILN